MFPVLLLLTAIPALSAVRPAVADKVADRFIAAPLEQQRIEGLLGERMKVNLEGRLLHVDEEGLLNGFESRPGKHPWIGEHVGKFLHASVLTYRLTHNEQLKANMDRMARRLIATQKPDGYLGTYTDDQRWTSWDVWVHKYNLIGLLSYYELTGDEAALAASRKMGDLMVRTFGTGPGQRDIIEAGTHVGMAATSILEPVCMLYRYTGEKRYLDFAHYIVDQAWNQPNGPKIIKSLRETRSVYRTANAKAYEMMSNLVGLVDLYRLTGRQDLLEAAQIAWRDIRDHRLYITGTTSAAEHFKDDGVLPGEDAAHVGEGCATVTWLQLNWQLLRLTGEAQYGEQLERTVYNQLLGAQDPHNGNICYFTPVNGRKNATPGINCCVSSEPRGIAMLPQFSLGTYGGGIAVELYTPGEARMTVNGDPVTVRSATDYPVSGGIQFTISPAKPSRFPLYLRVPAWAHSFEAKVGGSKLQGKAGEYLRIDRKWNGDTVAVNIDMSPEYLQGAPSYPGFVAVRRGPQILALDAKLNPDLPLLYRAGPKDAQKPALTDAAKDIPIGWGGTQAYALAGVAAVRDGSGKLVRAERKLLLVPFADAMQYRIWLPAGERVSVSEPSLAAFREQRLSGGGNRRESITDERLDTWENVQAGKTGTAYCEVELPQTAEVHRVVFHPGPAGSGSFAGAPEVQVQRSEKGNWETLGALGANSELQLSAPVRAVAVRIAGKPAAKNVSCAELELH